MGFRGFVDRHKTWVAVIGALMIGVGRAADLWVFIRDVVPAVIGGLGDLIRSATGGKLPDVGFVWPVLSWTLTVAGLVVLVLIWRESRRSGFEVTFARHEPERVVAAATRDPDPTPQTLPTLDPIKEPDTASLDRVFVPPSVTPKLLTGFFENQTDAQGKRSVAEYLGKWMPIKGQVSNVQVFTRSVVVSLYLDVGWVLPVYVPLDFKGAWMERVGLFGKGDKIKAIGQIEAVSRSELRLANCELVDDRASARR